MSVKIHGKEYLTVAERVKMFHDKYPNGSIQTKLVKLEEGVCVIKSTVIPDVENMNRKFTGYAMEEMGSSKMNKTSFVEIADTSAIGRALAAASFLGSEYNYASANEVANAINQQSQNTKESQPKTEEQQKEFELLAKHEAFNNENKDKLFKWWLNAKSEYESDRYLLAMRKQVHSFNDKKHKEQNESN